MTSHRIYAAYLYQVRVTNLQDPTMVQQRFKEIAMHLFPLVFALAIPIAIIRDFIPTLVGGKLAAEGGFMRMPVRALLWRIIFFRTVLLATVDDKGGWSQEAEKTFTEVIKRHAKMGIPYGDPQFDPHHIAVLGAVLRAYLITMRVVGWREPLPQEIEVVNAWLKGLAKRLGVKGYPETAQATLEYLDEYEEKYYRGNAAPVSAQLLNSLLRGLGNIFPWPMSRLVAWFLRTMLFTFTNDLFVAGFLAKRPSRLAQGTVKLTFKTIRGISKCWSRLFPYRRKGFDFALLVNFLERHAEPMPASPPSTARPA